jgi:hypothetical protein
MYADIISMAQQASPNVSIHNEDFRAMAKIWSVVAVMTPGTLPAMAWS